LLVRNTASRHIIDSSSIPVVSSVCLIFHMSNNDEFWIYHERQQAALCGQHALNNLVQAAVFNAQGLAEIAMQLDQIELDYMAQNNEGGVNSKDYLMRVSEGSGNVDPSGNFSIEVLRSALLTHYNISLPNIRQEKVMDGKDVTEIEGFICNRQAHWFAIRKINGRFWNLNSTFEKPILISHFRLATEIQDLQNNGYSVFCIAETCPAACTSKSGRSRGLPQYWWKESDLVSGKSNAITEATDTWNTVGSGLRLDGKANHSDYGDSLEGLTDEKMMQMALYASLVPNATSGPPKTRKIEIIPEPAADAAEVATIQFRMLDGTRVLRRFLNSECVAVLYAFVEENSTGQRFELRYSFPPKNLAAFVDKTIGETKLNGENIQARLVS